MSIPLTLSRLSSLGPRENRAPSSPEAQPQQLLPTPLLGHTYLKFPRDVLLSALLPLQWLPFLPL